MSAPPALRGCTCCGNLSFSQEWYKAFGVVLCNGCKAQEELIPKVLSRKSFSHDPAVKFTAQFSTSLATEHSEAVISTDGWRSQKAWEHTKGEPTQKAVEPHALVYAISGTHSVMH